MSVTWADIKDLFEETIGDTTQEYFDDGTQERLANNAINKMAEAAEYRDVEQTGNLVVGTSTYTLSGMWDVWRAEVDDKPMTKVDLNALRSHDPNWRATTGTPTHYYTDETRTSAGARVIGFWPEPSSILAYRVYGHGAPVEVDNDNVSYLVHVPEWAAYGVLFGMLKAAYAADTKIKNENTAEVFGLLFGDILFRLRARSFSKLNSSLQPRGRGTMNRSFWDNLETLDGT